MNIIKLLPLVFLVGCMNPPPICKHSDPKYLDQVKIIGGFYRGSKGVVIAEVSWNTDEYRCTGQTYTVRLDGVDKTIIDTYLEVIK